MDLKERKKERKGFPDVSCRLSRHSWHLFSWFKGSNCEETWRTQEVNLSQHGDQRIAVAALPAWLMVVHGSFAHFYPTLAIINSRLTNHESLRIINGHWRSHTINPPVSTRHLSPASFVADGRNPAAWRRSVGRHPWEATGCERNAWPKPARNPGFQTNQPWVVCNKEMWISAFLCKQIVKIPHKHLVVWKLYI